MEKQTLEQLLKNRALFYFYQLSQIPRGSGNEKQVSDYILNWARDLGLQAKQDEIYNLIIRKPASTGCENIEPVLLQAHLDMVCDKEPGIEHNFLRDAINWHVEGEWIYSENKTTLGADCGIGVALIMSVLENNRLKVPELEVLLTVREETDMAGAYNVRKEDFQAKRLINLDISPDNRLLIGACGGVAMEIEIPVDRLTEEKTNYFSLNLRGMKGGHSGLDINHGRGNAILLLARMLEKVWEEGINVKLINIQGGNSRLAIPREAEVDILIPEEDLERMETCCEEYAEVVHETWAEGASELEISLQQKECRKIQPLTTDSAEKIVKSLLLSKRKIFQWIVLP